MATNDIQNELTTKQRRAVAALLTERTVEVAAQKAAVSQRTLMRWLADPAFRVAVRDAEAVAIDTAGRRLASLATDAADVYAGIFEDPTARPALKLRAAQLVLDHLLQLRELVQLEERVQALEAALPKEV